MRLNYVANKIIEVFQEAFPDDTGYIASKKYRLAEFGEDKAGTFYWAIDQLDDKNFDALCNKLGIENNPSYFHIFKTIMQKL